jgi:hypothetical protein
VEHAEPVEHRLDQLARAPRALSQSRCGRSPVIGAPGKKDISGHHAHDLEWLGHGILADPDRPSDHVQVRPEPRRPKRMAQHQLSRCSGLIVFRPNVRPSRGRAPRTSPSGQRSIRVRRHRRWARRSSHTTKGTADRYQRQPIRAHRPPGGPAPRAQHTARVAVRRVRRARVVHRRGGRWLFVAVRRTRAR